MSKKSTSEVIAAQWQAVDRWRQALETIYPEAAEERREADPLAEVTDEDAASNPALDALRAQWRAVGDELQTIGHDGLRWVHGPGFIAAEEQMRRQPVLRAIAELVHMGYYPPPEYLLALAGSFVDYLAEGARGDLETSMVGPRIRKAGNYAARSNAETQRTILATRVVCLANEHQIGLLAACRLVAQEEEPQEPTPGAWDRRAEAIQKSIRGCIGRAED